jgi:CRP/FNR family transcriptional regulator, anaerobic regulatory protein
MEELINFLNSIRQMSPDLENHLRTILVKRLVAKKDIILKEGQVSKNIYYIRSGLVQGLEWRRDREVTTWIMKEGNIIISPESFLHQVRTKETIIALEDGEFWGVTYQELQDTYEIYPEFNLHGRIITGEYYILNKRLLSFRTGHTALEMYQILFQTDLDLINRVPSKLLASYLDVTPETLSTIRSQFRNKQ